VTTCASINSVVPARKRILVVEDDPAVRNLYKSTLIMAGFDVLDTKSGYGALQWLDAQPFDLVVLDLMLPGISGETVCAEITSQALTRHIPIVVVTGVDPAPDGLDVACILRKPTTPDALVNAVRKCLASGAPLQP
jgi:two-component system, OmpR family, response regulator MprA